MSVLSAARRGHIAQAGCFVHCQWRCTFRSVLLRLCYKFHCLSLIRDIGPQAFVYMSWPILPFTRSSNSVFKKAFLVLEKIKEGGSF